MVKFIKFDSEMLEKEHLSVLRELGREIGVRSSTSKKKDVLIKEIIDVQNGVVAPEEPSKRGAPPKLPIDLSRFYRKNYDEIDDGYEKVPAVDNPLKFEDSVKPEALEMEGVFEQLDKGYGFIRCKNGEGKKDVYVSQINVKKFGLRDGDEVKCLAKENRVDDSPAIQSLISVNGKSSEEILNRKSFDELTPCYPTEKLFLETEEENDIVLRIIDLFAPLGKGQRGLIVAPPKTGKTTLLKNVAQGIVKNHQDVKLIVLLIDERPEEVTDIKRSVSADVEYSTFDQTAEHHVKTAENVISKAKRLVEDGKDVVILLDSITRLTRAYNNQSESSGRTLSGGIDPVAFYGPKSFFGSARNIEGGGSLTILATALVDTGSRMDEVIFEEFKGTGNMEIRLSRSLAEKRVFPAIDVKKSGTRKEELLLSEKELDAEYELRKILSEREDATELLIEMLKKSKSNKDLLSDKLDAWLKIYQK